jgi:MgtC family protein
VNVYDWLPPEAVKILLVLFLSFLIGLEREEHKAVAKYYGFGGVRTFPLIGLIGYSLALLSGTQLLPLTLGFLVVGSFLLLSYWHKLSTSEVAGVTSEMSGLATFLVGALVYYGYFWTATALSVASLLLLELKAVLERLATRIPPEEIFTFAKFLLLTAVVLPILPDKDFSRFHIARTDSRTREGRPARRPPGFSSKGRKLGRKIGAGGPSRTTLWLRQKAS